MALPLGCLASVSVGAPLAWLTARTDVPQKGLIRLLVLASFVTPPFLGAFAWVMLAGPNAGLLNALWRSLTGAESHLVDIFTMPGLVFVVTIYTFPYVYIMIANTLALIASDLEEAASILGAGRLRVALTVTLPLVLPALASGFILSVLQALALFGSPAILALPAGFHTITTQIWTFFHFPPKTEMAAAFSIPLLLATALLLLVQKHVLGRRGYAAIGGKGGRRRTITLELGVMTACVGTLLVALLSYVASRRLIRGSQIIAFLALAPVVIPGVVLAVALFIAYTRPPLVLYGTLWILFVAYLTKEMP